jgi:hypothetical protein
MAMRGVDDDDIDARIDQTLGALEAALAGWWRRRRAGGPARPWLALGCATAFSMSFTVIRPTQRYWSSTTSSFSMRMLVQQALGLVLADASRTVIEILVRHQFGNGLVRIGWRSARRGW